MSGFGFMIAVGAVVLLDPFLIRVWLDIWVHRRSSGLVRGSCIFGTHWRLDDVVVFVEITAR